MNPQKIFIEVAGTVLIPVEVMLPKSEGMYYVLKAHSTELERAEFTGRQFTNYDGYRVKYWVLPAAYVFTREELEAFAKEFAIMFYGEDHVNAPEALKKFNTLFNQLVK
jgi:hypothetical protein